MYIFYSMRRFKLQNLFYENFRLLNHFLQNFSKIYFFRFASDLEKIVNEICLAEFLGATLNICLLGYYSITVRNVKNFKYWKIGNKLFYFKIILQPILKLKSFKIKQFKLKIETFKINKNWIILEISILNHKNYN